MSVRSLAVAVIFAAGLLVALPTAGSETPAAAADEVELRLKPLPDGVKTIRPTTLLPPITNRVTIDGYTQPGASTNTAQTGTNAQLRVELDGSNLSSGDWGPRVESGDGTVIRGLVINRFNDDGIELEADATNTRIAGCFIGTDAAGTAARPNAYGVYADDATGTRIGSCDWTPFGRSAALPWPPDTFSLPGIRPCWRPACCTACPTW